MKHANDLEMQGNVHILHSQTTGVGEILTFLLGYIHIISSHRGENKHHWFNSKNNKNTKEKRKKKKQTDSWRFEVLVE